MLRIPAVSFALLAAVCALPIRAGDAPVTPPVTADTVTPPELIAAAEKLIKQLSAESFDDRDAAAKGIAELDIKLLPWLRKLLDDDKQAKKLDPDSRNMLMTAMKSLVEKNDIAVLRHGTPVRVNFKQLPPAEILTQLDKQSENSMSSKNVSLNVPEGTKLDFKFEGTYWDAVLELQKLAGCKVPDKRETLTQNFMMMRRDTSGKEAYFMSGVGMGVGIAGVCALRVARVSWEADAMGRFLTFIVVPHLEPRYKTQQMTITLESIELDNGVKLTPLDSAATINQQNGYYGMDTAAFAAAVKDELKNCKTATLNMQVDFEAFENKIVRQDITAGTGPFKLLGSVTLNITPKGESYQLKMEGSGGSAPRGFDGQQNSIMFYDINGKQLTAKGNMSRSSSSGSNWSADYSYNVTGGTPTHIEVIIPVKRPKVNLPLTIKNVPLPFTPAAAPESDVKSSGK